PHLHPARTHLPRPPRGPRLLNRSTPPRKRMRRYVSNAPGDSGVPNRGSPTPRKAPPVNRQRRRSPRTRQQNKRKVPPPHPPSSHRSPLPLLHPHFPMGK